MNAIVKSLLCFVGAASLLQPFAQAAGDLTAPQPPLLPRADGLHAEVQCRLSGGWLLVPVEIDGTKAWFQLGTGWGTTQVTPAFVKTARLSLLPRFGLLQNSMSQAGAQNKNLIFARGGRFQCGNADAECVWLGVQELGDLAETVQQPLEGVLGWDLLRHACFTIDYTVPSLTWHRPGAFKAPERAEKLMLRKGVNYPVVECAVGNAKGWAMLNTATQVLEVAPGFANQNADNFSGKSLGNTTGPALSSAESEREMRPLLDRCARAWGWSRRVSITLGTVKQAIASRLDSMPEPEDFDMSLGYNLLRNFRVTFDGPGGVIWLEPAAKSPELAATQRAGKALSLVDWRKAVANDDVEAAITSLKQGGIIVDGKWKDKDVSWLATAIYYRSSKCTIALLDQGSPVEPVGNYTGDTPLQIAAELGDVPLIKRLLKAGADPRRRAQVISAVIRAVGSGSLEAVLALMPQQEISMEEATRGLVYASHGGNPRIMEVFMKALPANLDFTPQLSSGLTESCLFGQVSAARWYLSHGAAVDDAQEIGVTPLLATMVPGPPEKSAAVKRELTELLLKAGAAPNSASKGISPLLMAAEFGTADSIQLLLKAHAKATDTDHAGSGVLAYAAGGRQPAAVVKLLLEAGAEKDRMDANDQTPLMAFARHGDIAACKVLLDAGADINKALLSAPSAVTLVGQSFLCRDEAAAAMVTFLKANGAKMAAPNFEIGGPLAAAISSGRATVVESVIKAGVDPNLDFGSGLRPLHLAAATSNRAVVAKLIELGADPKALDKSSVSVLGHAAAAGRTDIIALLLESGQPPEGPPGSVAPLGFAVAGGQLAAVRQLITAGANPNAQSPSNGKTILQSAPLGDTLLREVLIAAGAKP